MSGNVIIISSPSGGGKGTLIRELMTSMSGLRYSVSHTTRPIRPGETEGEHYHFVSREEFSRKIDSGGFLEHAVVHGNYYGTSLDRDRNSCRLTEAMLSSRSTFRERAIGKTALPGAVRHFHTASIVRGSPRPSHRAGDRIRRVAFGPPREFCRRGSCYIRHLTTS